MSTYNGRFMYLTFLLVTIGVVAVCAGLYKLAIQDTRTVTVTKAAPKLTATASAEQARSQYQGAGQPMAGTDLGLPEGITCDVYELRDGATFVCHG